MRAGGGPWEEVPMPDEKKAAPQMETAEDRFEHEIEDLEAPNWKKSKSQIFVVIGLSLVVVAVLYFMVTAERKKQAAPKGPEFLHVEMLEPRGGKLANIPGKFKWEVISGTKYYSFRVGVQGRSSFLIERSASHNAVELTSEEKTKLARGATYTWTLEAYSDQGKILAKGQGSFEL